MLLQGMGVEIGIPYLHRDAGRQFLFFPEIISQPFHHTYQQFLHMNHVDAVFLKGPFRADGFTFGVRPDRGGIDPVGPSPDLVAVLAQYLFHHLHGHILQGSDGLYTHRPQQVIGLVPYHRDLPYGKRGKKRDHPGFDHFQFPVGFGFSRGNLGNSLVHREPVRDRQSRVPDDLLAQLMRPLHAAEETVHPRYIYIMLVDGGLFIQRRLLGDDICHQAGIFRVHFRIPPDNDGIVAKIPGQLHGHGRMYPVLPRLITAAGHHSTIRQSSYNHRLSHQAAVPQTLDRYKEGIQVEVHDISFPHVQ